MANYGPLHTIEACYGTAIRVEVVDHGMPAK